MKDHLQLVTKGAQVARPEVRNVGALQPDVPGIWLLEPCDAPCNRGFARPRAPHQGQRLPCENFEFDLAGGDDNISPGPSSTLTPIALA